MSCPDGAHLAAAIDGELTHNAQRALDAHLSGCPRCAAASEHLRALRSALPTAFEPLEDATFRAELERRIDARAAHRRAPVLIGGALTVAAALSLLLVLTPASEPAAPGRFRARGAHPTSGPGARLGADFFAHPHGPGGPGLLLEPGAAVTPETGFSFVLYNQTGASTRFMLFARDARGELHWFYPAWRSAAAPPRAPLLDASPAVISLPEGVTPDALPLGPLELVALFSPEPLSVVDVEAALAGGRPLTALVEDRPSAALQRLSLTVTER